MSGQSGGSLGAGLLVLAVACTAFAMVFYGPLAWPAGLAVIAPVAVLSGTRRRRLARRGMRRAARVARQSV